MMQRGTSAQGREKMALRIVARLSELALSHFENLPPVEIKPDRSLVSRADFEVEELARELLGTDDPGCVVYGEEGGFGSAPADFDPLRDPHWVLDPIDGTTAFLARVPTWAVLLAYVSNGQPVVGVVALPALGEVFSASIGSQATHGRLGPSVRAGEKPVSLCRGSGQKHWAQAYVAYSSPSQFSFRGCEDLLAPLAFSCREFRTTGDAFGYTRVLLGAVDLMMDLIAAPYDLAAVEVLARQTPGVVLCTSAGASLPVIYRSGGAIFASTQELMDSCLEQIRAALVPFRLSESSPERSVDRTAFESPHSLSTDAFVRIFRRKSFGHMLDRPACRGMPVLVSAIRRRATRVALWEQNQNQEGDGLRISCAEKLTLRLWRHGRWEEQNHIGALSPEKWDLLLPQNDTGELACPDVSSVQQGEAIFPFILPKFERHKLPGYLFAIASGEFSDVSFVEFFQSVQSALCDLQSAEGLRDAPFGEGPGSFPLSLWVDLVEQHEVDTVGSDRVSWLAYLEVWEGPREETHFECASPVIRFDLLAALSAVPEHASPKEAGMIVAHAFQRDLL
jgi:histidinol-phosphatase